MTTGPTLQGLLPVLATPFSSSGEVHEGDLGRLVEFQLESQVDGLVVLGVASEAASLSRSERNLVARTVRKLATEVPLIAGLSEAGTAPLVEEAKRLEDAGVDAVMVMPPIQLVSNNQALTHYFGSLDEAISTPIIIQEPSTLQSPGLSISDVHSLSSIPKVQYIKVERQPTLLRTALLTDALDGRLQIIGGQNALYALDEFDLGAIGTMPACTLSDRLRSVIDTYRAGRIPEARQSFHEVLPLLRFGLQPGLAWAVHKHTLEARNIISGVTVRPPALPLPVRIQHALNRLLEELSLVGDYSTARINATGSVRP